MFASVKSTHKTSWKKAELSLVFLPLLQETMPQTPIFSSMLGSSCSGQVQPDMGERCVDPVYQDGNLVSGSLEALIERLVPTMDYYPDVSRHWRVVFFSSCGFPALVPELVLPQEILPPSDSRLRCRLKMHLFYLQYSFTKDVAQWGYSPFCFQIRTLVRKIKPCWTQMGALRTN